MEFDQQEDEEEKVPGGGRREPIEIKKKIKAFDEFEEKATQFITEKGPEEIMEELESFCKAKQENEEAEVEMDDESYKALYKDETNECHVKVKVLKMEEEGLFCVDFTKKTGQLIDFQTLFREFRRHLLGLEEGEEEEDLMALRRPEELDVQEELEVA